MHGTATRVLKTTALATASVLLVAAGLAAGATINVPGDASRIQDGIFLSSDGDTVLIGPGVFSGPGNCGIVLNGRAISVLASAGPESTTIDCQHYGMGFLFYHEFDSGAELTGFTITDGWEKYGGGILCTGDASPVIRDCVLAGNEAMYGGGIACQDRASPSLIACTIIENTAVRGGGVYAGPASSVTLTDCVIARNTASDLGGGIDAYLGTRVGPIVTTCTIVENSAPIGGGVASANTALTLDRCIIAFNLEGAALHCPDGMTAAVHCVSFGNAGGDSLPGGGVNLLLDPLLCGLTHDDYHLCSNSPALSSNNTWSMSIGALEEGCDDCSSPVREMSWGKLKSLFR